jgi:hypothetical protein
MDYKKVSGYTMEAIEKGNKKKQNIKNNTVLFCLIVNRYQKDGFDLDLCYISSMNKSI